MTTIVEKPTFESRACPYCGQEFDCTPGTPGNTPCSKKCPGYREKTRGRKQGRPAGENHKDTSVLLNKAEISHVDSAGNRSLVMSDLLDKWLPKITSLFAGIGPSSKNVNFSLRKETRQFLNRVSFASGSQMSEIMRLVIILDMLCERRENK